MKKVNVTIKPAKIGLKFNIQKVYPGLENLEVTPSKEEQNFKSSMYGYNDVKVKAVDNTADENIVAENIRENVEILGVKGNVVELKGDTLNVSPSTSSQQIVPTSPVNGFTQVNVAAVTKEIDKNINPYYIRKGIKILGVEGNVNPLYGTTGQAIPSTERQTIYPRGTYNGFTSVTVEPVTAAIDKNISAENIKEGVSILGVQGEFSGVDTSDATATSGDMLKDKTAYVDGNKVTGNIETYNEDVSYMPDAEGKTFLTNGKYMTSDITVLPIETEIKTVNGSIDSFEVNASENKYMEQVKVDNSNLLEAIGSLNVVGETEETTEATITDAKDGAIEGITILGRTDEAGQKVAGKNKFNYEKASNTANTFVSTYRLFEITGLKPNTQYTISGYDITEATTAYIYLWSGSTMATAEPRYWISGPDGFSGKSTITFTSNAEGSIYLAMYQSGTAIWNECIQKFKNAQIEEGTIETTYAPYNSIEIKITDTVATNIGEQIATFPLGEGKTLGEGDYLTESGRYNADGTVEAYTTEQLKSWTTIKNLTLNEGTNHITSGGNLAPKFKLKYKQDSLEVIRNLLNN